VKAGALISILVAAVAVPCAASAGVYNLHMGGVCSHNWREGKGVGVFGAWSGQTAVDVQIDMTGSIPSAAAQLEPYLDSYCTGANSCFIYTFSAGDAVLGYLLANRSTNWNIGFALVVGGAGGGSRLAGDIAALLGCNLANDLTESHVRNLYNHNDTEGETIYRIGGRKELTESRVACVVGTALSWLSFGLVGTHCLSGKNDGAVEYHSSGGYSTAGQYADFWDSGSHWGSGFVRSYIAPSSADEGRNLNHSELKSLGVCLEGGIPNVSGLAACTQYAEATHSQ
jgi:hypothetical protein